MSFFWYSTTGGKEKWSVAPSDQRQKIISDLHPVLVTVLDAKQIPQDDWSREQFMSMKYSGPLYMDWDSKDDLAKALTDMQTTLARLVDEYKVDPTSMSIYATGGKGFHLEIPMEVFCPNGVPKAGVTLLPYVYRHMALEFVTPSLDMKVYSARRGRHWRVPNIQRDNGKYKVQITYAEAMTMDLDMYDRVTSEPRLLIEPTTKQSAELMSLFLEKRDYVANESKRAIKAKDETRELARFNGQIPESVKLLMAGMHLRDGVGFNNIAMQFAIVAHALGKSEQEFLEACEGVIQNHTSDGRYNSPRKRREALRERFYYTDDNPCYIFSFGGIRSIAEEGFEPDELRPSRELMMSAGTSMTTPDNVFDASGKISDLGALVEAADAALGEDVADALKQADRRPHGGVIVSHRGVFAQTKADEFPVRLSYTGFIRPWSLIDVVTRREVGMQVNILLIKGDRIVDYGRHEVLGHTFSSRSSLDNFLSGYGSGFTGTDIQATCVRMALKDAASKEDNVTYLLSREGVDVITDPDHPEDARRQLVFVSGKGVVLARDVPDDPFESLRPNERFMFKPKISGESMFRVDNIDLNPLDPREDPQGVREWLSNMLRFNKDPYVVASTVGWFVSTFHRQVHHHLHGQFPLMQIYGPAGSGKTSTPSFLARMFWTKRAPPVNSATRNGLTPHARRALFSGSASIPAMLDEFKRGEMGEVEYGKLIGELRTAYNCGSMSMGGIKDGSSTSDLRTITELERSAPICTMTETLIDETAFMERCVIVPMQPANQDPQVWEYLNTEDRRILMGRLGTLLLWHSLKWSMDDYAEAWKQARDDVKAYVSAKKLKVNERPMANISVVICGLRFLKATLNRVGVAECDQRIDELCKAVLNDNILERTGAPKAEIYKALSDIAWITNNEDPDGPLGLREGRHYAYVEEDYLDVDVRSIHVIYNKWCKDKNLPCYYATAEALASALRQLPALEAAVTPTNPPSPIKTGMQAIFRFRAAELWSEDVEHFRSKVL